MGREIRKVPPNWIHPTVEKYDNHLGRYTRVFQPMLDIPYKTAIMEWVKEYLDWESGKHEDLVSGLADKSIHKHYAIWAGNPPEIEYYREDWPEGYATWFQVYETITEGTPTTPPFATKEELVEYLVKYGDSGSDAWPRERAERFVYGPGWSPSLVIRGDRVSTGVEDLDNG